MKKHPSRLCSSFPENDEDTKVPIRRRFCRLSVVVGMLEASVLVTGSQSVQCTTAQRSRLRTASASGEGLGSASFMVRIGGGSTTRRSLSPKPQALAAHGS